MPANLENSAVATGLEKFSFHFNPQKKAIPKNTQTTAQLHSSHMLVMFNILQARLQQYVNHELPDIQAVLEKAEEPEIKLPTSTVSFKKQESSRKISISALFTTPKSLTMWITTNSGKFWKGGDTRLSDLPPEKSVCRSEATVRTNMEQQTGSKWVKEYVVSLLI